MKKFLLTILPLCVFVSIGSILAQTPTCVNSDGFARSPVCASTGELNVDNHGQRLATTTALTVTAGAYTAKDVIGGEQTITAGRDPMFSGIIRSITVADKAAQAVNLNFHFFKSNPASNIADNAAFDPSDADLLLHIGTCEVTTHHSFSDNSVSVEDNCDLHFDISADTLYYYIEAVTAPTYASTSDVQVTIVIEQD